MSLRIELDTIRKQRNAKEWRPINRARCEGIERTGDGNIISLLCKDMIAAGYAPSARVEVYRSGTPCFFATSLSDWADGRVGKGEQPEHLRRSA